MNIIKNIYTKDNGIPNTYHGVAFRKITFAIAKDSDVVEFEEEVDDEEGTGNVREDTEEPCRNASAAANKPRTSSEVL